MDGGKKKLWVKKTKNTIITSSSETYLKSEIIARVYTNNDVFTRAEGVLLCVYRYKGPPPQISCQIVIFMWNFFRRLCNRREYKSNANYIV